MKNLKAFITKDNLHKVSTEDHEFSFLDFQYGDVIKLRDGRYYIVDLKNQQFTYKEGTWPFLAFIGDGYGVGMHDKYRKYDIVEYYPLRDMPLMIPPENYSQTDIKHWVSKYKYKPIKVR